MNKKWYHHVDNLREIVMVIVILTLVDYVGRIKWLNPNAIVVATAEEGLV